MPDRIAGPTRSRFVRLTVAASLARVAAAPAVAQSPIRLRVGAYPSDTFCEAYYADEKGFYKDAGISVEITTLPSGAQIANAVLGGALDVGVTNGLTVGGAFLRNVPLVLIASAGLYNPAATQLCVPENAPIRTAKDFEGKIVAISSIRGTEWLGMQAWVDQNGGDSTKVRLTEIPYTEIAPAAIRGTIAGGVITEPAVSVAKAAGGIRTMAPVFDVFGPRLMLGGWVATTSWLRANAASARRFIEATYATARWANTHQNESALLLAKFAKLDPAQLRSMSRCPYGETLVPAMIQPAYDLAYKYKIFERPVDAVDVIAKV